MDRGQPAATIDVIPLEWFFGRGVKLDFRHFPDGSVVQAADVERELARIGHELKPFDIVVVNTSAGKRFGDPDYVEAGCGMGREATLYLTSRGVRVTGTDCWSWDAHFKHMAKTYDETRDVRVIWEGHKAGREIGYCHIEKMHNLEVLPAHGFTLSCFPVKVRGGSAGFTRAVAIFED
jgi:kynurenine formamidase